MPNSTDDDLNRHRRPKPDAFKNPVNPTAEQARSIFFKQHRTDFSATASSLCAIAICFPLDTLKTRLQASTADTLPAYRLGTFKGYSITSETIACTQNIYRTEGFRAFWRGLLTPLVTASATRVLSMHFYQNGKYFMDDQIAQWTGKSPLAHCNDVTKQPNWSTFGCFTAAGAFAGAMGTLMACPFELTKVARQLSTDIVKKQGSGRIDPVDEAIRRSYYNKTTWQTMGAIYRNRGVFGLYSGFRQHLLRDVVGTAVWFVGYESMKQEISYIKGTKANDDIPVAAAGFLSGCISLLVTSPMDTMKTKYQRNCLMHHRDRTEKVPMEYMSKAAWRGMPINLMRSGMTNLVFFVVFERTKKYINAMEV